MKKNVLFLCIASLICSAGCKKDNCWQGFIGGLDCPGMIICDKSRSELEAMYPGTWFYKPGETKYCWKLIENGGNVSYATNIPESIMLRSAASTGTTCIKMDCNTVCKWEVLEKSRSKITGLYDYTKLYIETFLTDTCTKLYVGKVVVYRETADSIITRIFDKKY